MSTYIEIKNINNIISIDDQYRYLHNLGTLYLNNGAYSLHLASRYDDEYDDHRSFTILRFDRVNYWMYPHSLFLNNSSYPRYIAYIAQVNKNRLYGIRFKKRSSWPKIYVRVAQSPLGCAISHNMGSYIFIEVVCSDNSTDINSVEAYLDYFEIVEIGISETDQPSSSNFCGAEFFDSSGSIVWKSTYRMVNIESYFSGNLAGKYTYSGFTTNHIIVPSRTYKSSRLTFFDGGFSHRGLQYKDFYTFGNDGLQNVELLIAGQYGDQYQAGAVWDGRDFGTDSATDKQIAGLILR